MPEPIVYPRHERPDVEVLWQGAWCPGELRMQEQDKAGQFQSVECEDPHGRVGLITRCLHE